MAVDMMIIKVLKKEYKKPQLALNFENAFQLLIATILAAQTRDERVNKVTPAIFERFSKPDDMLKPGAEKQLEGMITSINFYRKKLGTILNCCKLLVEKFNSTVPDDIDVLATFPGIGRKTASMVIANAYSVPAVFVDTHVSRVSQRIGLTENTAPEKIEEDIKRLVPRPQWTELCLLLIMHGKAVCQAKKPLCERCVVSSQCGYYKKFFKK